jgi:Zn-dependent membrane protease YugP
MFAYFDPMYFLILAPAMLLAIYAQWRVKSAYHKASQVRASSGLTGAETARLILESHDIADVGVEPAHGFLSDHYDPRAKKLRLSPDVYQGRSVASLGIAAHEAGHAIQDAKGYAPLKIRNGIVPLAAVGSNLSMVLFMIGMFLAYLSRGPGIGEYLMYGGIILFAAVVVFQLVNLPVEFNASRRAKDLLQSTHMVAPGAEAKAMDRVLNAAALTYVAGTLTAILTLVYLILRSGLLGSRN